MATFAPPARHGDFLYSSVLYADPGNENHHPRAAVAELAALLRPEAPNLNRKGRKPDVTVPAKDPAWHYYSAQLIHYGLPVTKDKNAAKVRLLNALNQFKLEVPAWILKLEGELKKEWDAENRKLKKSTGTKSTGSKTAKTEDGHKKGGVTGSQGANGGVNVTVNLSLSSGHSMLEQLNIQQAGVPIKPSPAKRKRNEDDATGSGMQKKVVKVKSEPTAKAKVKKDAIPKQAVPKQTVPKQAVPKKAVPKKAVPRVKQEHHEHPEAKAPSRSRVKQEHISPRTEHFKTDPYADDEPESQRKVLSGSYIVNCPAATDYFGEDNFNLTLSFDSEHSIWWATFQWGAWDGIIQMNPGPISSAYLGQACSLGWRLRDLESGDLTFGRKCTGEMTFFQNRTFSGCLFEMPRVGRLNFSGKRLAGPSRDDDLQHEWDEFVKQAYGR